MEGIRTVTKQILTVISKHPHHTIFCTLFMFSILINSILIGYMGLPAFIDSFNNPSKYELLSSDQLTLESSKNYAGAIIERQCFDDLSKNELTGFLCLRSSQGTYTIYSQTREGIDASISDEFVGEVVTLIPNDPVSLFACLWWQQTIEFKNNLLS